MKKTILLLSFFFCFAALKAQTVLDTAQDFSVKDIYGNTMHLFDILDSGKFVVLDFFTTSCGPCNTYAPDMQASYTHFGSNQGNVIFLGLNFGGALASVMYFDSVHGITFPTSCGNQCGSNEVNIDWGIMTYPTTVLVSPNRLILNQYIWPPSVDVLDSTIASQIGIVLGTAAPGIPARGKLLLSVFPNPAREQVKISFDLCCAQELSLELYNMVGTKVLEIPEARYAAGANSAVLPVTGLLRGVYTLRISGGSDFWGAEKVILTY